MNQRIVRSKGVALGLVLAFVASAALLPGAGAQTQLNVRSVGEIFVDASGKASGQNLVTSITEAEGVLEKFTAVALGAEVFSTVSIDGFSQAEKMQGVGSSTILLRGSNAVVSLYDNINSEFRVQATAPTTVRYSLASGAEVETQDRRAVNVHGSNGAYLGSLVILGPNGGAGYSDSISLVDGGIEARLATGSQVVWHARPVYVSSADYQAAVVATLANGYLSSKVVTEFTDSTQAQSKVDYFANVQSQTRATSDRAVETDVRSRAETSTVLAYDLAYESLPATSPSDVAVYANGKLATRADSASQVAQYAEAGVASYFAIAENGRTQVLTSTPDFRSQAQHRVTVVAHANANSEAQARADNRASSESRATGAYDLHANGKLTGVFTTGILDASTSAVHGFTVLGSRTEVFESIRFEGSASSSSTDVRDHRVTLEGPRADVTLVDDVSTTVLVDARETTTAVFDLGTDVKATMESSNLVRLEGPNGFVGTLVAVRADADSRAPSEPEPVPLQTPSDNEVHAHLDAGTRLVFRSQADSRAHASENVVTQGIAAGQIGGQVLAGIKGSAVAANGVSYSKDVDVDVVSAARGVYVVHYTPRTDVSKTFVLDSRGTALAAKQASDVRVLVDGQVATAVNTPQATLQTGHGARYFVDTTLEGQTRVIVNTAAAARERAIVTIESQVDAAARAKANTDSFGVFKLFYDGTAMGSFVSLKSDQQAGVVNDFTMISTGQTVFESIQAGASGFVSAGADGAPQLFLENREAKLEFTDTTSAYMKIVAQKATRTNFVVAPDVRAEQRSQSVVELTSDTGNYLGSMIITDVEGKAAVASYFEQDAGNQIRAELEEGSQVIFRTHVGIEAELSAAQRTMINHAIASGRVAGQILVQSQQSLSAVHHAQASARTQLEATASTGAEAPSTAISAAEAAGRVTTAVTASYYNDVQMVTAATQNRVDVTVSSTTSLGKTVLVSLDPATIPGMALGEAEILVDGRAAVQASSYADVLNPNDDNGVFEYFVLAGEAGTQVLVSMPHFSTHTVTLKARESSAPPVFMYATIFLGVLVVAETALLVRRRTV